MRLHLWIVVVGHEVDAVVRGSAGELDVLVRLEVRSAPAIAERVRDGLAVRADELLEPVELRRRSVVGEGHHAQQLGRRQHEPEVAPRHVLHRTDVGVIGALEHLDVAPALQQAAQARRQVDRLRPRARRHRRSAPPASRRTTVTTTVTATATATMPAATAMRLLRERRRGGGADSAGALRRVGCGTSVGGVECSSAGVASKAAGVSGRSCAAASCGGQPGLPAPHRTEQPDRDLLQRLPRGDGTRRPLGRRLGEQPLDPVRELLVGVRADRGHRRDRLADVVQHHRHRLVELVERRVAGEQLVRRSRRSRTGPSTVRRHDPSPARAPCTPACRSPSRSPSGSARSRPGCRPWRSRSRRS